MSEIIKLIKQAENEAKNAGAPPPSPADSVVAEASGKSNTGFDPEKRKKKPESGDKKLPARETVLGKISGEIKPAGPSVPKNKPAAAAAPSVISSAPISARSAPPVSARPRHGHPDAKELVETALKSMHGLIKSITIVFGLVVLLLAVIFTAGQMSSPRETSRVREAPRASANVIPVPLQPLPPVPVQVIPQRSELPEVKSGSTAVPPPAAPAVEKKKEAVKPAAAAKPAPEPEPPADEMPTSADFDLTGIMYFSNNPQAVINGVVVSQGEVTDNFEVVKIYPASVVVKAGGRSVKLYLKRAR